MDPRLLDAKGSLFLTRPTLGHDTADRAELRQRAGALFAWIAAGALTLRIGATFPLSDAAATHRYLEQRRGKGNVLLLP